jgi:hypothetical protein
MSSRKRGALRADDIRGVPHSWSRRGPHKRRDVVESKVYEFESKVYEFVRGIIPLFRIVMRRRWSSLSDVRVLAHRGDVDRLFVGLSLFHFYYCIIIQMKP